MAHRLTDSDSMFTVRKPPWHGLGVVLDEPPRSIDEALEASGLGWQVRQGAVLVVRRPEWSDDFGRVHEPELVPAETADGCRYRANLREDAGELLGIVSDDYRVVPNRDAFASLDALLGSELQFETAGSLHSGRRVWVLAASAPSPVCSAMLAAAVTAVYASRLSSISGRPEEQGPVSGGVRNVSRVAERRAPRARFSPRASVRVPVGGARCGRESEAPQPGP